jgi:hypothetical protein
MSVVVQKSCATKLKMVFPRNYGVARHPSRPRSLLMQSFGAPTRVTGHQSDSDGWAARLDQAYDASVGLSGAKTALNPLTFKLVETDADTGSSVWLSRGTGCFYEGGACPDALGARGNFLSKVTAQVPDGCLVFRD